jgi:PhzF family phenazine biosynthesis protein
MFASDHGVSEDPATGSSIGPLAVFMLRHRLISAESDSRFVSEQGTKMGRRSLLQIEVRGRNAAGGIYVGGHVTPIVEANMTLGYHEE